ncbi:hypothetical protein H4R18_000718 [Coemansia javaensis]|uniref:Uncharacterized protein n=1 Tax=Coemansia javaensis TaxID=2761396 RepID=A0A9W8LMN1_9FUNG|nr:hypothetical protein H4R18_000718 [Coemansia javaensis]
MVVARRAQDMTATAQDIVPAHGMAATAQWLQRGSADDAAGLEAMLGELAAERVEGGDVVTAGRAFKALADLSRDAAVRGRLAQTGLARASSAALQRAAARLGAAGAQQPGTAAADGRAEHVFLLVQVLRCVCNVSADNDAARDAVLAHGGVAALARVLAAVDEVQRQPLPVGQAAFGAALNVALDHAACAAALLDGGALAAHVRALSADAPGTAIWPLVATGLDSLCDRAAAVPHLEAQPGLARAMLEALAATAARPQPDPGVRAARRALLWTLCEALERSAALRRHLCRPADVALLFDVLEHVAASRGDQEDQEDQDRDDHAEAGPPSRPIPGSGSRQADAVAQMLVGVSGEDAALDALFGSGAALRRIVAEVERGGATAAAAALCLGNLARTDAHCEQLVAQHAPLVRRLVHEWLGARQADVHLRHAASGLLKNLCLPAANRAPLAAAGLPRVAAAAIATAVVPIQANAIGILRHLATGAAAEATVGVLLGVGAGEAGPSGEPGEEPPLQTLLRIVRETDIDAIRCEGTRLVASVAKRLYVRRPADGAAADAADALDAARRALEARALDVVTPLARLVMLDGQRHPLLQQECLVALTVLAAPHAAAIVALLDPARSAPLAAAATCDGDGDGGGVDEARGFGDVLRALLAPPAGTAVWPQSTLQAKSLVAQLAAAVERAGPDAGAFDAAGLAVLRSDLATAV